MAAQRLQAITPFHVMALLARARQLEAQGRSIVHMEIGEPDFVTPAPIVEAGISALQDGRTHYTPALGLPELRSAIARHYQTRFGVDIDPGRVIVTPGASGALQLVVAALVDPGQEVLLADPGYPCNRNFVRFFNGVPVAVSVDASDDYQLNAGLVERYWSKNTVAAMLSSPSNPTGTVLHREGLATLLEAIRQRGGSLIVDEIYQNLHYQHPPWTALELGDDLFVLNSFSKYFGMTGWRLGWLIAPEAYVESLDKLAQNIFLAAPTPSQYAALAAFNEDTLAILEQRRLEFQARRDYLLPALQSLGFDIARQPEGAFYLYANISRFSADSYVFVNALLEEVGVAITPGIDFGEHRAQEHVRFAYTTSLAQLELGVERIRDFISNRNK